MTTLLMCVWLAFGSQATARPDAWLKGFEGTWVVDNAQGADADITVTIARDAQGVLVLTAAFQGSEMVSRYDPSGKDVVSAGSSRIGLSTKRTRIDKQKLVTEIWDGKAQGAPQRIETRYLESADVMITELARTPGGSAFNRTALRRKPKK